MAMVMLFVASLLMPLCLSAGTPLGDRESVSFDFGWRHRTGLHEAADPDAPPPAQTDPGIHPPEAEESFDDGDWETVQLPHDALVARGPSTAACPDGCSGKSYIPRHVLWYRKRFHVPSDWEGSSVWVDFEGSFRNTTVYFNGQRVAGHTCGYTPFRVRLDNITSGTPLRFGPKAAPNTLAVFIDPDNGEDGTKDKGSGWWYEGGGLYRKVHLVRANYLHIEQDGLYARSDVEFAGETSDAGTATEATIKLSATVRNDAGGGVKNNDNVAAKACVSFSVVGPDGRPLATHAATGLLVPADGGTATAQAEFNISNPTLWDTAAPAMYTIEARVYNVGNGAGREVDSETSNNALLVAPFAPPSDDECAAAASAGAAAAADSVSIRHGVRKLQYDANNGFALNEEHFKVRGFCDHNTFAVVGMAVPDRISLFRAQASRAVGGNGRRTSHNPPDSAVLDIYDALGMVVMDENRIFANRSGDGDNMAALVKRDRNHPSVVVWSFCNEAGCEGSHETGGPMFQSITKRLDPSRPTLANMFTFGDLLSNTIDIQGFSHQSRDKLNQCHERLPNKPIYLSECCSCNTMRDEDEGCETKTDNPHNACIQKSFNARCTESNAATNASDGVDYAIGTMIWTLLDYYGEPPVGPLEVSSTYGQFDIAGFPKAAAFWYRTQWLLGVDDGRTDKTFKTGGKHEVRIVESWESPDAFPSTKGNTTRTVHAYTSASQVEVFVNNVSQGVRSVTPMRHGPGSYAEWLDVPWSAGTLTAVARDGGESGSNSATEVARHERRTNGAASALQLSIDAPSQATGTGTALLLDGQDAALLRATVVDDQGHTVHLSSHNVSFSIVSGPGRIQGCHNGDPHSHLRNDLSNYPAYHGLVRAVVRVTSVAGRCERERQRLAQVDVEGPFSWSSSDDAAVDDVEDIVVEATVEGLPPARVTIPVSTKSQDAGVMAAARASAGQAVDFFSTNE